MGKSKDLNTLVQELKNLTADYNQKADRRYNLSKGKKYNRSHNMNRK